MFIQIIQEHSPFFPSFFHRKWFIFSSFSNGGSTDNPRRTWNDSKGYGFIDLPGQPCFGRKFVFSAKNMGEQKSRETYGGWVCYGVNHGKATKKCWI